ncbi:hypothetical protein HMPREF9442_00827 [Paraprevotella xylaniphila YIT 11841]|uniref:Uncharacterized protein n=1 Tax=Paraprevotella xylaniphila YIT 11841 TaxID=762982 RepID=F3QRM3_9BACT|nr:hypothetical protein [Paraprevotella xylaniphila]EGG55961.1 hypothetical protein HMPREF9442_00827 [Paraprevotella xylaniphila YIT 11841]
MLDKSIGSMVVAYGMGVACDGVVVLHKYAGKSGSFNSSFFW